MATVIGIAGSARRNGNSTTLMRAALRGVAAAGAETSEVCLDDLPYHGCRGCARCAPDGGCVIDDALTPVLEELREADGWILASPIYFDGVTGQMKSFYDRCYHFTRDPATAESRPQLAGRRVGLVIVTYEDEPRDDYRHAAAVLANYLGWMGDFGEVGVVAEGGLGPADAAANRPDLLARVEAMGRETFGSIRH